MLCHFYVKLHHSAMKSIWNYFNTSRIVELIQDQGVLPFGTQRPLAPRNQKLSGERDPEEEPSTSAFAWNERSASMTRTGRVWILSFSPPRYCFWTILPPSQHVTTRLPRWQWILLFHHLMDRSVCRQSGRSLIKAGLKRPIAASAHPPFYSH